MSPASLPANALTTGAAMFLNANVAAFPAMAQSAAAAPPAIPLPPGDEDLRKPQKSPTPPTNQKNPNGPPLPPPANLTPAEAEEQAKRAFELSRRETQLNAREEAIKELEADLNARIAASEKSKAELADLLTRNQAILEEQKAAQEQKRSAEDAAKEARVEHLVLVLKGMKPEQAGQVINSMDDQVAVGILSVMPGSNAGKILAMVQPEKAARLIKAISEKRIDPKAILERQQSAQNQAPAAPETPAAPGS
jgi:flagellar motility protein MotE (MotC chaperone)